jgi:hypothetical protein
LIILKIYWLFKGLGGQGVGHFTIFSLRGLRVLKEPDPIKGSEEGPFPPPSKELKDREIKQTRVY